MTPPSLPAGLRDVVEVVGAETPWPDPQIQRILDGMASLPAMHTQTPEAARAALRQRRAAMSAPLLPVGPIEEIVAHGPAGAVRLRVYRPAGGGSSLPTLVYFHGGGWVVGDLEAFDPHCRVLVSACCAAVISVDYRLAPEHRFPAALEDAFAATEFIATKAADLGADPTRIVVGGDSAGGNLAAAVCILRRDRGLPLLSGQMLLYPILDRRFDTRSYRDYAEGYFLRRQEMMWFWDHYLGTATGDDPHASPLRARTLTGLPPALVATSQFDPLRDEGETYAARLACDGVATVCLRFNGLVHGFLAMSQVVDRAAAAVERVGAWFRDHVG
jgi:acetyl esterase